MAQVAEKPHHKSVPAKQRVQAEPGTAYHQVDNTFRLTTPENISFEYQLAGPFRRLFPYILDLLIVSAMYAAVTFLLWLIIALISVASAFLQLFDIAEFLFAIGAAALPIGWFFMYWFYGAYMETYYNGRTFGKMLVRLRVISTDGHAIDGTQATLRNLFRMIDLMPLVPVAGLLESNDIPQGLVLPTAVFGLVVMSLSPKFQRLGDLVAGTMVVNEEGSRDPHVQAFADSRVPQLAELIPSSFYVSNSLSKAVAVYVERREQLGVARSGEIAAKLAGSLIERFGLPADTDADLLICSLYYKVFVGEPSSTNEPGSNSEPSSNSESNLDKKSELGSNNESPPSPSPKTGSAVASRYGRPEAVAEPVVVADPDQAANPSVPALPPTNPPTNSELE